MTAIIHSTRIGSGDLREEASETGVSYRSLGGRLPMMSTQTQTPVVTSDRPRNVGVAEKALRKLFGFLLEENGAEARVGLVENGELQFYDLPYAPLRENGIVSENQHFEMNEVEMRFADGRVFIGYSYKPLATAKDAFVDNAIMTDERKRKLALIARKFGKKAQD
jgi:hypothetical protein